MSEWKRTRSRTIPWTTTLIKGVGSLIGSGTGVRCADFGQYYYHLALRKGTAVYQVSTSGISSVDTLSEGFPVRTPGAKKALPSYRQLRRIGWYRPGVGQTSPSTLSTVRMPVIRVTVNKSVVSNAFLSCGFSESPDGVWSWRGTTRYPATEVDQAINEAYSKIAAVRGIIQDAINHYVSVEVRWEQCTMYVSASASSPMPTGSLSMTAEAVPSGIGLGSQAMNQARFSAFSALQSGGRRPKGMNRLRSILEMKDVPQTCKQVMELAAFIAKLARCDKKLTAATSVGTMIGGYLGWKFGIQPTIDDVNRWWSETVASKAIALIDTTKGLIAEGSSIRAAYRVSDHSVLVQPSANTKTRYSANVTISSAGGGWQQIATWERSLWELLQAVPGGHTIDLPARPYATVGWTHKGVLFGRAFRPPRAGDAPNWAQDLYPELRKDFIEPLSEAELAIKLNPPVQTAWQLLGWSWLADMFGNIGETLDRLVSPHLGLNPVRCMFKTLWARDTWVRRGCWPRPDCNVSGFKAQAVGQDASFHASTHREFFDSDCVANVMVTRDLPLGISIDSTLYWRLSPGEKPGSLRQIIVERGVVPEPQIPPVHMSVPVGASRLLTLGALTIQRALGLSKALRGSANITSNIKTPSAGWCAAWLKSIRVKR